jgi:ParB-like chromosome segregation protein Spo0J
MATDESGESTGNEVVLRSIKIDDLRPPENDVRQERDDDEIRDLAMSMDQNGQLQAAKVFALNDEDSLDGDDPDDLGTGEYVDRAYGYEVVDGMCRREAAKRLGWPTLRCEVWREPPPEAVLESLAANTDRLSMSDYETLTTLDDLRERTGMTIDELSERVEYHPSTLSQYLGALDGYGPAVEQWQNPQSHVGLGHVLELAKAPNDDVRETVFLDVMSNEKSVGMTRETVTETTKAMKRNAQDDRSMQERQRDGEARRADREVEKAKEAGDGLSSCDCCGSAANTKIALDVCPDCRGMLIQAREAGDPLMAPAEAGEDGQDRPGDGQTTPDPAD